MATARPDFDMTISHAAEHGTRLDLLKAMRRVLAEALEDERTQPRDLSPITMRLREVAAEISQLEAVEDQETSGEPSDEPFTGAEI